MHPTGYNKRKNFHVNEIPSKATKTKNIISVSKKFIKDETFFDNKNKYFGTLTFVKIPAFAISELIPPLVASLK
jgi:hypothetical protein